METRIYELIDRNSVVIETEITKSDMLKQFNRDLFHLTIEKLSDKIYEEHIQSLLQKFSTKSLVKSVHKKLEIKINTALNKLLKLEK